MSSTRALRLEPAKRRELRRRRGFCDSDIRSHPQVPCRRSPNRVELDALVDGDDGELAFTRLEDAKIRDDHPDPVPDARDEVETFDEGPRRLAQHHEDIARSR